MQFQVGTASDCIKTVDQNTVDEGAASKKASSISKNHLYWSMELLPSEAHDYESQCWQTIKHPLNKAEVVNQCADVWWDNEANSQKTLKQREHVML